MGTKSFHYTSCCKLQLLKTAQENTNLAFMPIQYILNFSMTSVRYIKSFSKGQVTIPKAIRDHLGLGDDFWLKLEVQGQKILAEPTQGASDPEAFLHELLQMNGGWLTPQEQQRMRQKIELRLQDRP